MKAVIMAGGLGMRLRPLTKIIPKPLLPLGESSIIDTIIHTLHKAGVHEIILATNYKSEIFIEKYSGGQNSPIPVKISKETEPLGTAGHISLLKEELTEPFFVVNGDILTNLDFKKVYQQHLERNAAMTIITKQIETPLAYGVVKSENGRVLEILEKPNIRSEILAGMYVLSPEMFDLLPYNGHKLMTDLVTEGVQAGKNIQKFVLEDYWLDIGHLQNYEKAIDDVSKGLHNL